jgi:nitroreductase
VSAAAEPEFSDALPDPEPSPETLRLLATRRSTPAHTLRLPGPTAEQTEALLRLGLRVPDHGKLAPWRVIVLGPDAKAAFLDQLLALPGRAESDFAAKKLAKLTAPPLTIVVVSRPVASPKIPVWEQELSAGAVCMNLLVAAEAMGFGANWITDWYAYDAGATAALGLADGERVAGFVHVGTPSAPRQERDRPRLHEVVEWR